MLAPRRSRRRRLTCADEPPRTPQVVCGFLGAALGLVDLEADATCAQCEAEAELAEQARDVVVQAIENAERVEFCEPLWGKYAGRVVARVVVDGEDLAEELIIAGLAHAYDGGQREGWCEPE